MFSLYINKELRQLWPLLTFVGLAGAFVIELLRQYVMQHALPALRLWQTGGARDVAPYVLVPELYPAIAVAVVLMLLVCGIYWLRGRTASFLLAYKAGRAWMPMVQNRLCSREDRSVALRLFLLQLPVFVVTALVTVLVLWVSWKHSWWYALLLLPVVCYVSCGVNSSSVYRAVYGTTFGGSLALGFGKHWGRAFSVQLLCAIPTMFVQLLLLLPIAVYLLASFAAADSQLIGDDSVIPTGVQLTCFFVDAVAVALYVFVSSFSIYALTLRLNGTAKQWGKA